MIVLSARLRAVLTTVLLPTNAGVQLHALAMNETADQVTVTAVATRTGASCPVCASPTTRVHSRYWRSVADVPCGTARLRLHLHVRRFFCTNTHCPRRVFAERLPQLVAPAARRTQRLTTALRHVGLALGGAAGARLTKRLHMPTSRDTLLRLVRQTPLPVLPPPHAIGVDEWAVRKGCRYGTILVDLERHCPIDLLADHSADRFTAWLHAHPSIQVISRDRAGAYAEGASTGAPQAMQVADRFHLVKNVGETLVREFERHASALTPFLQAPQTLQLLAAPARVLDHATIGLSAAPVQRPPSAIRRGERHAQHAAVHALHQHGLNQSAIAQHLHLDRKTVRTYLQATQYPAPRRRAQRRSILDPYKPYVVERWNGGCHNSAQLWRELTTQGFTGKPSLVKAYVAQLRDATSTAHPEQRQYPRPVPPRRQQRRRSLRELARLVLQRPDRQQAADTTLVATLSAVHPAVAAVVQGAQTFVTLVRERRAADFDAWLAWAATCDSAAMRGFAASLRRDAAAVRAALQDEWNNGQTEGQVNRLKMLKRQMFGRAKLDLLRQRFLAREE